MPTIPPSAGAGRQRTGAGQLDAGDPVLHLAFGEAGLPVLPSVAERPRVRSALDRLGGALRELTGG